MSKYETLDALILVELDMVSPRTFNSLRYQMDIMRQCDAISAAEGTRRSRWGVAPWRILDRRLQALRKAGKIRASTKGWTLAARDGGGS